MKAGQQDYQKHYEVLGLRPPCDQETLKKAYRRLANQHHPDRLGNADPTTVQRAEEQLKLINLSYTALTEYHQRHGKLPPVSPPPAAPASPPPPQTDRETMQFEQPVLWLLLARRLGKWAVLVTVAALVLFSIFEDDDGQTEFTQVPAPAATTESVIQPPAERSARVPPSSPREQSRYFGYGSTLGEVHAIQGIPTRTEGDVWYYGKSTVRFRDGVVVSWYEDFENPLKANIHAGPRSRKPATFTYGSSREEVREAQGMPRGESENTWYYGESKVFFDRDKVTGWEESPLNPLKISH